MCLVGNDSWAFIRTWVAMIQFIMCAVGTLRRAHAVDVDDVSFVRGERRRRVGGNNSLLASSLMMDGVPARDGTLVGELIPSLHVGFWTSSRLHMKQVLRH